MALTLVSNPVVDNNNLFAGFLPVEFEFKREDENIVSIGAGINNKILITTTNNLSSLVSVNDGIYLYAVGDNGHIYDLTSTIILISGTQITIDADFIELATGGYINYKQNYYLEIDLVKVDNDAIKILPFTLRDDGKTNGEISIDVSIANDLNYQYFAVDSELLSYSRLKFKVRYREVSDIETTAYTKISDEIVLVYASDEIESEDFIYFMQEGEIYKGYDSGITFAHTALKNDVDIELFQISMNELDENQNVINANVLLKEFSANDSGIFFIKIPSEYNWNILTEYVSFNVEFKIQAFFDGDFFSGEFFET